MWTTLALPHLSPEHLWTLSSGDQNQTLFTVMCARPVVLWRVSSNVPRPSHRPIFDRLQCAKTEGEGLAI